MYFPIGNLKLTTSFPGFRISFTLSNQVMMIDKATEGQEVVGGN